MSGKLLAVAIAALVGCSSNPGPEAPLVDAEPEPSLTAPSSADGAASSDMASEPPPPPAAAARSTADPGIPDDYHLTAGDCDALGKQFGFAWRSDEVAKLNPKLSEKQRAQAEKTLEEGASKAGERFAEGCHKSLVGKSGDPKSIKCALDARSVKLFDACLNGDPTAAKAK